MTGVVRISRPATACHDTRGTQFVVPRRASSTVAVLEVTVELSM